MLKLPEVVRRKLAEEFRFSAERIAETDSLSGKLYFFSAFYGEVNRALNYEWSKELGLMHMVLNGAHQAMSGRVDALMAGAGGVGITQEFPDALARLSVDWASLIERREIPDDDFYTLLARTAELAYAMTGNGFYLYLKGAITLSDSPNEPEPPSSQSRGAGRPKA